MPYLSLTRPMGEGGVAPVAPAGSTSQSVLADYLTETQLAEQLGESTRTTARRRLRRESPPHIRIGRRYYYRCDAVLEWLKSQERPVSARRRRR